MKLTATVNSAPPKFKVVSSLHYVLHGVTPQRFPLDPRVTPHEVEILEEIPDARDYPAAALTEIRADWKFTKDCTGLGLRV